MSSRTRNTQPAAPIATEITPERIRSLVRAELRLSETVPMNESFHNLGFTNTNLIALQGRIAKTFNRSVRTVYFSDTIYTITDRLNGTN